MLIVGAGMTGISAAIELHKAGQRVLVIDKARGLGGRMSTRRASVQWDGQEHELKWDHGAQYFTAKDSLFENRVREAMEEGAVRKWADRFGSALRSADAVSSIGAPRWIGQSGMTDLCKWLIKDGPQILARHKLTSLKRVSTPQDPLHWVAQLEDGQSLQANVVLLTCPAPQILEILGASDFGGSSVGAPLPERLKRLQSIRYWPCLALLTAHPGPSKVPSPGGTFADGKILSWIADQNIKKVCASDALTAMVIHAAPEWSRSKIDADPDEITAIMLAEAAPYLPTSPPMHTELMKWRYALPETPVSAPVLGLNPEATLWAAGDAMGGPRVEGAYRSGYVAAKTILSLAL